MDDYAVTWRQAALHNRPVLVGVDGSPSSLAAAHYAAQLAQQRRAPLHLVYGHLNPMYGFGPPFITGAYAVTDEAARTAADQALASTADELRAAYPHLVEIRARLRAGGPAAVLIDESRHAALVVVGCRGTGGFAGLPLGSISAQVAAHAQTTVIVVRPPAPLDAAEPATPQPPAQPALRGPVLAGFDGSPSAHAALEFAVNEAQLRHVRLIIANVYWQEPWGLGPEPKTDPADLAAGKAERMLTNAIGPWQAKHPGLDVELRLIHSLNPEHRLVEESKHAGLTVVGCRGRGGFAGMLLGSVSQALVHHAHGPVAVVHSH